MDTKLTLKLNEEIIRKAKKYAHRHHTSLSRMIENYLRKITEHSDVPGEEEITPLVKSLSGIIRLPRNYNPKKNYTGYLPEKYK